MGVLAHQGGWDEILLILGPMALVVVLLRLAKRRVERNLANSQQPGTAQQHEQQAGQQPGPAGPTPPEG